MLKKTTFTLSDKVKLIELLKQNEKYLVKKLVIKCNYAKIQVYEEIKN